MYVSISYMDPMGYIHNWLSRHCHSIHCYMESLSQIMSFSEIGSLPGQVCGRKETKQRRIHRICLFHFWIWLNWPKHSDSSTVKTHLTCGCEKGWQKQCYTPALTNRSLAIKFQPNFDGICWQKDGDFSWLCGYVSLAEGTSSIMKIPSHPWQIGWRILQKKTLASLKAGLLNKPVGPGARGFWGREQEVPSTVMIMSNMIQNPSVWFSKAPTYWTWKNPGIKNPYNHTGSYRYIWVNTGNNKLHGWRGKEETIIHQKLNKTFRADP